MAPPQFGSAGFAPPQHAPPPNFGPGYPSAQQPLPPHFGPGQPPPQNPFAQPPPSATDVASSMGLPSFQQSPPQAGSMTNMFGSIPPPAPAQPLISNKAQFLTVPKRTQIMLVGALVAGMLMLFIVVARNRGSDDEGPQRPMAPEPVRQVRQFTQPVAGPAAGATPVVISATTPLHIEAPPVVPEPHGHGRAPVAPPTPPVDSPERRAADAITQGRFRDAIQQYAALAAAHPEAVVYQHIATVLRRKIDMQEQPCIPGGSSPCDPSAAPANSSLPSANVPR